MIASHGFNSRSAYVVRTTGTTPRKPVDTAKWLKKVAFVAVEFRALVKMITQPSLSAMFGSRVPVHIVPNTVPVPPDTGPSAPRELSAENIKSTFAFLGYTWECFDTRDSLVQGHPGKLDRLVGEVEAAAKTSTPEV